MINYCGKSDVKLYSLYDTIKLYFRFFINIPEQITSWRRYHHGDFKIVFWMILCTMKIRSNIMYPTKSHSKYCATPKTLKVSCKTSSNELLIVLHVCNCHLTSDEDWMAVEIQYYWVGNEILLFVFQLLFKYLDAISVWCGGRVVRTTDIWIIHIYLTIQRSALQDAFNQLLTTHLHFVSIYMPTATADGALL